MSGETFEALFRREYSSIQRTVALIVMDREVGEEVTQEAFARLHERWAHVEQMDKPGAWVRRVAIREAVNRRDRSRRRSVVEATQLVRDATDPGIDVDVVRAVAALPRQQRAAVVLHYFEDLPVAEVARTLGCAEATARVHLHRARQSLAAALGIPEEADDVAR